MYERKIRTAFWLGGVWLAGLLACAAAPATNSLALNFGGGAEVTVPHASALNAYPFTVSFWVRTATTNASDFGLVNKYVSSSLNGWHVYLRGGHALGWYFGTNGSVFYVSGAGQGLDAGFIADDQWHQITFTVDDAGGKIFTDGALRDARAWTGTPGACSTTEPVHFARYPGPASLLTGRLDSISLWNVAMSADQVLTNLTKVFQGAEPGLLGLWQGEEFAGTNVFDLSPAARHGARLGTNGGWSADSPVGFVPPVLLQVAVTNLTATNAEMRVALNPRGVGGSVLIDLGATTNYGTTFTQALAAGVSDTALVIPLAGLASHTTYHQRARVLSGGGGLATNSADATFTTPSRPVALTFAATNLTPSRATLQGAVQPDGTNVSAWFEYGRVSLGYTHTSQVFSVSATTNAVPVSFTASNLIGGGNYQARLVVLFAGTRLEGAEIFFSPITPVLATFTGPADVGARQALFKGYIQQAGDPVAVWFQHGPDVAVANATAPVLFPTPGFIESVTNLVTGLPPGTTYFFRIVATNGLTTFVSGLQQITTKPDPLPVTLAPTALTVRRATLHGTVLTPDYPVTARFELGLTTNYGTTLTAATLAAGAGAQAVSVTASNLAPGGMYHVRLVADFAEGTAYGADQTFTLLPPPEIISVTPSSLGATSVTFAVQWNAHSQSITSRLDFGATTAYGATTPAQNAFGGETPLTHSHTTAPLPPGTAHHARARLAYAEGEVIGGDTPFTTPVPLVVTLPSPSSYVFTNIFLNGEINAQGAVWGVYFEYGLTTNYDQRTAASLAGGFGLQSRSALVTGLLAGATYHFRFAASNEFGTYAGADATFTLRLPPVALALTTTNLHFDQATFQVLLPANPDSINVRVALRAADAPSVIFLEAGVAPPSATAQVASLTLSNSPLLHPGVAHEWSVGLQLKDGSAFIGPVFFSATQTFLVPPPPAVLALPTANVTAVSAEAGSQITFNGETVSLRYNIRPIGETNYFTAPVTRGLDDPPEHHQTVSNLWPGFAYYLRPSITVRGWSGFPPDFALTYFVTPRPEAVTHGAVASPGLATLEGFALAHHAPVTAWFEYGATTNYGATTAPQAISGTDAQFLAHSLSNLAAGVYQYRLVLQYVTGPAQTNAYAHGSNRVVTLPSLTPVVTVAGIENVLAQSATVRAGVSPYGLTGAVHLAYGPTTNYGFTTAPVPVDGSGPVEIAFALTNLFPATSQHCRAVFSAVGSNFVSGDSSFTTLTPVVVTLAATALLPVSATLNGRLAPGGGGYGAYFEHGLTTNFGAFTATNVLAGGEFDLLDFAANLSGLTPGQDYFFRARADHPGGTLLGATLTLHTPPVLAATLVPQAPASGGLLLRGQFNPGGAAGLAFFEYGGTTNYGNFSATNAVSGVFTQPLNTFADWPPGLLLHVRAGLQVGGFLARGGDVSFTPPLAQATTLPAQLDVNARPLLRGEINTFGATLAAWFEYGATTNYGATTPAQNVSGENAPVQFILSNAVAGAALHYRVVAQAGAALVSGADAAFTPLPFADTAGTIAARAGDARWADFNLDGRLDLIVCGASGGAGQPTQIWLQQSGGGFLAGATLPAADGGRVAVGDVDNDGWPDVLLCGYEGTNLFADVWRNLGDGQFAPLHLALGGVAYGVAAFVDFDNDGRQDLFLAGDDADFTPHLALHRNLGGGRFAGVNHGLPARSFAQADWADFDGDGRPDLALSGFDENFSDRLEVWKNLGGGNFSNVPLPSFTRASGGVAWLDADGDGRVDLLAPGRAPAGSGEFSNLDSLLLLRQQTNGAFAAPVPLTRRLGPLTSGDFDGDGHVDFLVNSPGSGGDPGAELRLNHLPDFPAALTGLPGWSGESGARAADYDGDGRLDLFLFGSPDYFAPAENTLRRNVTAPSNSPPTAPANLAADTAHLPALLTWSAGADDVTPAAALTYNLRVGTAPGLGDIVNPAAANALRRLAAPGNVGAARRFPLHGLANGIFYWSVQALDAGFAASAFAPEQIFTNTVSPQIILLEAQAPGWRLHFRGEPGVTHAVEFSTNLVTWLELTNLPAGPDGQAAPLLPDAPGPRFYRVRR